MFKKRCSILLNRGASRWPNSVKNVPLNIKSMYWSQFLNQVYDSKYIINVDEAGFWKSVKENYSWLPRGQPATIINDVFSGRTNLIMGVSQIGDYLGLLSNKTISSREYSLFLVILSKVLNFSEITNKKNVVIIQD